MTPRVTVLLPVYNGERYLSASIQSVLGQTFRDFEFLIVDDGSTDGSRDIIHAFDDARIRLIRNGRRLKLSGALNRGLDAARGEYVARMDADDICRPRRLESQVAFLDRNPRLGMCGTWVSMFGLKRPAVYRAPTGSGTIRAKALFDNPFVHPTVMLRKRMFDRHHLRYDGRYYPTEDFELWGRAIGRFPCGNLNRVLLDYRQHAGSMTGSDWTRMDLKSLPIVRRELSAFGLHPDDEQLRFHRNIGREMSCRFRDRCDIARAERWLLLLLRHNTESAYYRKEAFREVLGDNWFRLCLNSAGLGPWVFRRYLSSPLTTGGGNGPKKRLLVLAAVTKAVVFRTLRGDRARR